ncbi:hypothetical protein [Pseudobacteriovorax antillogorgiicola]|uniref:Uncharacterized protein n=1 Tax=Pseudobacteriovorax antillogorgiicola TaxID=1513793 RepID=A0A1Y6CQJ2_9BACT|nr:hypothetical protein [Pseudobacteriovorax antillogorgiicola]TCS41794.1 hypothetical protein EDD56_1468 [Pseudobacteriovorax antillogorgiicola]SMF83490.1 hypothetical protein SAMN06296036_14713 [Pseudobacteriovorax antillogorgiicola]
MKVLSCFLATIYLVGPDISLASCVEYTIAPKKVFHGSPIGTFSVNMGESLLRTTDGHYPNMGSFFADENHRDLSIYVAAWQTNNKNGSSFYLHEYGKTGKPTLKVMRCNDADELMVDLESYVSNKYNENLDISYTFLPQIYTANRFCMERGNRYDGIIIDQDAVAGQREMVICQIQKNFRYVTKEKFDIYRHGDNVCVQNNLGQLVFAFHKNLGEGFTSDPTTINSNCI